MPPDLATITERVARLRDLAASRTMRGALLAEIADALSEGYASALEGDAWTIGAERRARELIDDADTVAAGRALRALATECTGFQRELATLRRELAELHRRHDRLRPDVLVPLSCGSAPARPVPAARPARQPGCGSRRRA